MVRGRHLGEGWPGHGQARRRLDDRRAHRDRSRPHRLRALLSAPDGRDVHRGPLQRGCAEGLQSGGASARTLRDRPQHPALAFLRAREGTGRLFHGAGRLGARPRLCRQRAPAGEVRQSGAGARERVGQPPFLARVECRASRHERGLRHREPVAFRDVRCRRAGSRRAAGLAVRCQDRRRQQHRQGHLHALSR